MFVIKYLELRQEFPGLLRNGSLYLVMIYLWKMLLRENAVEFLMLETNKDLL